ncbi:MAG: hypothetical protein E7D79_15550 [Clostridium perfringens]|uniref:Phage protein n=1 Tax=Clostridium perfringens TaxID=1502 RepID=A0AAW4J8Z3_CLOPF|nr:hypothetical protein [Clostridium perfringens]EHP46937.1 hypothetical protein HMPREF9476_02287 [Clostridium perfringens WAL-14572]MBO3357088.1 hypothetical protein [Clostridium perfringens]MBO3360359.1 hypothetical protein [Clostridium perfringens]MDM0713590.1 hypothetical protein [Clostridium perfringens]MDU1258255.1 hypothetical protein [Clostridium perfringens]
MNTVRTINGFNFHFEVLDFQGDNKKFYITYHNDISFRSFDIVINRRWIDKVGFEEAMKYVSNVWDNPKKATKKTLGDLWRIDLKLKYYRDKALENKCKEKIELIGDIEDKIVGEFKKLNVIGQVRALELLEDLIGINKYRA